MKNLKEYLIKESYLWEAPDKKDLKNNIDKLLALADAFGYVEYYDGRYTDEVLDWIGETFLNASRKEIESIQFYRNFDVDDIIDNFIDDADIDEDEEIDVAVMMDGFKKYLIEFHEIDETIVSKILDEYDDDIKKEMFNRGIIGEY